MFTHAVGDAAIDEVLTGYEAANAEASIVGKRWGIEHAFIGRADHLPRMKTLGLLLSLQDHLYLAGPSLVRYWGAQRAFLTTPVRMYSMPACRCRAEPTRASCPTRRSG